MGELDTGAAGAGEANGRVPGVVAVGVVGLSGEATVVDTGAGGVVAVGVVGLTGGATVVAAGATMAAVVREGVVDCGSAGAVSSW